MIYSMTGFGRASAAIEGVEVSIEINSVNRRNLELSTAVPREWIELETRFNALLRQRMERGKVHYQIRAQAAANEPGFHWDEKGLVSSLRRLGRVAEAEGIAWPPDGATLVQLAAMNRVDVVLPDLAGVADALTALFEQALEGMLSMRRAEGAALEQDLQQRIQLIADALQAIAACSVETVPQYREILFQRLQKAGLELELSDERVVKEIAIFADKCDISEEITRLQSHFSQFQTCLAAGSPAGRKLEFILQEINREFNTVGSKAHHIVVGERVVEAKNEIERIREQLQNIE